MKKVLTFIVLLIAVVFVPPMLIWLAVIWKDLSGVIATGMCPPAPPDIPAYHCSVMDFFLRMVIGPWALVGNVILFFGWLCILSLIISGIVIIRFLISRAKNKNCL